MNVQTETRVHALRFASTPRGATGVNVRRDISWRKMGKHAPKGREVSLNISFCFIQGHICQWYLSEDYKHAHMGVIRHHCLSCTSEPFCQPNIPLARDSCSSPICRIFVKKAKMVEAIKHLFSPQIKLPVKQQGAADLLLPLMRVSSFTSHNTAGEFGECGPGDCAPSIMAL